MKLKEVVDTLSSNDPNFKTLTLMQLVMSQTMSNSRSLRVDETEKIDKNVLVLLNRLVNAIKLNRTIENFAFCYFPQYKYKSLNWSKEGLIAIGNALKNHPTLKTLYLDFTPERIQAEQICELLVASTGKANIESLHIVIYKDTFDFLPKVGEFLAKNRTLKKIIILISHVADAADLKYQDEALSTFAKGLGNKPLREIELVYLNLSGFGIKAVANALSKDGGLESLEFRFCNLTDECVPSLADIIKGNRKISQLDLSYNPLTSAGIIELANLLPLLPLLKKLRLKEIILKHEELAHLAEIWVKYNLKIRELVISVGLDANSIEAIIKIINCNKYLKSFACSKNGITARTPSLKKLEKFLSDPSKCQLEEFLFLENTIVDEHLLNTILQIQKSNVHLRKIAPSGAPVSFWEKSAQNNDIHYMNSQNRFVNNVMEACNIYFSEPADDNSPHVKMLPPEVFFIILCYLGEGTLGMDEHQIKECCQLIFDNFSNRRKLINDKGYVPISSSSVSVSVSMWWSTRSHRNEIVFRSRSKKISDTVENISERPSNCNLM